MSKKSRLVFLGLSFAVLVTVGHITTGSFAFLLHQFWFTAGLFLLVLLSLVDQPHFSTDANVFVNGTTGWVSLLLVESGERDRIWWFFFLWALYLIVSSYILMWKRSRKLGIETKLVQVVSRANRQLGRPESLFSAFFLWGCWRQFAAQPNRFDALLLFWAVFMILNLPSVAQALASILPGEAEAPNSAQGILLRIISPKVAEATLAAELPENLVGRGVKLIAHDGREAARAVVIDDRVIARRRLAKLALLETAAGWDAVGTDTGRPTTITFADRADPASPEKAPISVVDSGTEIGKMVFHVHPSTDLQAGEVLWVQSDAQNKAFYQIISGVVHQISSAEDNYVQTVKVAAGQLGLWDRGLCRFQPVTWVAPAGELVYRASGFSVAGSSIPAGHAQVGKVPNSEFPVHVNIQDLVTHNTAIIGVTGSGKSYLAFHLIESMVANKIRVLVLDLSRQHYMFLSNLNPTALKVAADVAPWLAGESLLGIHQFAADTQGFPGATASFVDEAFRVFSKTKLTPGINEPAKLCVVFEEAHSLIPEWNQVAQDSDKNHVNRTARTILQGRKYGMGCLLITQRTANVTKTILNQCNSIFALQSFDQTGLDFLRNYMGEEYANTISTLPSRHAILVGRASSSARPILFCIDEMSTRWGGAQRAEGGPSGGATGTDAKP